MKTLNLSSVTFARDERNLKNESVVEKPVVKQAKKDNIIGIVSKWFNHDTPENISFTEAAVRGVAVILMPLTLSAFDWSFHTDALPFVVPVMFYLEVTAFTMYCPIKAMFTHKRLPEQFD